MDQAGVGPLKTARAQVEAGKFRIKVDVEPLAAGCLRMLCGEGDDRRSNAFVLAGAAGPGVEKEGMISAVPCHIGEPDQDAILGPGRDPTETELPDAIPPTDSWLAAMRLDEVDHLSVSQ